jgi:hypothetical protein
MSLNTRSKCVLVGVGLFFGLAATPSVAAGTAAPAPHGQPGNVEVVHLSVDGRYDSPEGLDNPRPTGAHPALRDHALATRLLSTQRQTCAREKGSRFENS